MSRTPAAILARLKLTYPRWRISYRPDAIPPAYLARVPGGRVLAAPSPALLEVLLFEAQERRGSVAH